MVASILNQPEALELLVFLAIMGACFAYPASRGGASVGLPLCYIVSLGMIHWLGALIHFAPFPWRSRPDPFTLVGFQEVFWASLAFAVGTFAIAPFILRVLMNHETGAMRPTLSSQQLRLPYIYIGLGVLFFAVLAPALRSLPSIYAASVSGIYLAVVGLCLACYSDYCKGNRLQLVVSLGAVCLIPLITIVTIGFAGYGTGATLLVLTFVATFYRPRWHVLLAYGLLGFLGLSLFVTYFRDRPQIRAKVWGGADYSDRIETLYTSLSNFELLDLQNPRHLSSIDARLNQNYLIGRAVRTIELGQEEYAYGGTIYEGLLALIPRILWPEKHVWAGSWGIVSKYARMSFDPSTSVGVGQVMEFYINFGTIGVIAGFLVLSTLIRILDAVAAAHLLAGNWKEFMSWFLPAMSLLMVGGSFVDLFGTAAASAVLVAMVNRILTAAHYSNV